jgi:hypothetical protein
MSDTAVAESGTRLQNFLDRAGFRGFPWKTASILYTISWGWLFIVRDSLWSDDWDGFKFVDLGGFRDLYNSLGFAPWMRTNFYLFDTLGAGIFRLIIFVSFFIAAIFLHGVLGKVHWLSCVEKQMTVLVFLLAPFNSARVQLNVFHYTEAYFLFFAAWYALVAFESRKSKFIAYVLFFLSFQMFTMLVFFLLPVAHLFVLERGGKRRDAFDWIKNNLVFILLPAIYWLSRALLWPSTQTYHEITERKVNGFFVFLLIFFLIFAVFCGLYRISQPAIKKQVLVVLFGLAAIFLGYFPYVLFGQVGNGSKVPLTYLVIMFGRSDWFSRHQILQPLGFSILLVGLIGLLPSFVKRFRHWFVGAILAISVVFNIGFGFEYVVDYSKQTSVVNALSAESNKTAGEEIQMVDQTTFLNARQRSYRERDWLGLIGLAEGVESAKRLKVVGGCSVNPNTRLVLIQGPETHWEALKNWVSDGDMGFEVTVDDTPGACKPEMVTSERVSGAIPILFYFTGAKG